MTNPLPASYLMGKNYKCFPLRLRTRQGCPLSPLLFNIVLEVLATATRQEEEIKGIQIENGEAKLSLFADDTIGYIENPIDPTKKLLDLVSEFGKTAGYKVNIQKSKEFLYTNTEISETEIRKKIPISLIYDFLFTCHSFLLFLMEFQVEEYTKNAFNPLFQLRNLII